jgi:HD superfamily phosphohydrolase
MSRTYRDPIHSEIFLDSNNKVEKLLIDLIDSRELQRLRWIKQLGTSWLTFHGAEATRFPHSLGSMHVANLMFEKISRDLNLEKEKYDHYRALVLVAALLHDIGHSPFSHSSEDINDIKHEVWTQKLILSPETEINKLLETYQNGFAHDIAAILNKTYPVKFLSSIVNSQLDCDRFDYLLRDSFHTGTAYGNFDLNRVIASITVDTANDCLVVSGEKGMLAVEDYLYARYSMYMQVYQHKKCLASDSHLLKLFQRVKMLIRSKRISYLETGLLKWITSPENLTVTEFLNIDDTTVMHHIKHWAQEKDVILKDLAKRFLNRKLFKAEKIEKSENKEEYLKELYLEKSAELKKLNLDPDYYLDIVTIASSRYSFYNPDASDFHKAIFVKENNELKEISTISHIVKSLVQNDFENSWMITVHQQESSRGITDAVAI